jgi:serine protease Do
VKRILYQSKKFDYVVFQVATQQNMPYLSLGDMLPMKGEDIVVLGNPRGLESTASRGIVSSIRDYQGQNQAIIQVDAAISPGSSGSPVMNRQGEVVGIATMKVNGCESCNYAFNINLLNH